MPDETYCTEPDPMDGKPCNLDLPCKVHAPKPAPPRRRFRLQLDLEGDTREDLISSLQSICFDLITEQLPGRRVSGGVHSGYILTLTEDAEQTHEQFVEQNEAYLKALDD